MINNPYKNTANVLVSKKIINIKNYINNIQDKELQENIKLILEFTKYLTFNEGYGKGKYEFSMKLKKLMNIEKPSDIINEDFHDI